MKRSFVLLFIIPALFFIDCNSHQSDENINPDLLYFDYRVSAMERSDNIIVLLQYRFGKNGKAITIDDPGKVELDGEIIQPDTSRITGTFYEAQRAKANFAGEHTITFTGINNKQYKEIFNFQPFYVDNPVPDSVHRDGLVFELKNSKAGDRIRVLLTDTLFRSEGINRVDTLKDGKIIITREDLETLVNGPIQLELIKEDERELINSTAEGGRIAISYTLRREFVLKD